MSVSPPQGSNTGEEFQPRLRPGCIPEGRASELGRKQWRVAEQVEKPGGGEGKWGTGRATVPGQGLMAVEPGGLRLGLGR